MAVKALSNTQARKRGVQWRQKEKSVELYLVDEVRKRGGHCIKLPANLYTGIPDRLVILPGFIVFVEVKRPFRGRITEHQLWWQKTMRDMGHNSEVVYTKDDVDRLMRIFG